MRPDSLDPDSLFLMRMLCCYFTQPGAFPRRALPNLEVALFFQLIYTSTGSMIGIETAGL
jgi:hypothetical protein